MCVCVCVWLKIGLGYSRLTHSQWMCQTRWTEKERRTPSRAHGFPPVITHARDCQRRAKMYVHVCSVQSCLRTVCVLDSVHTFREKEREREEKDCGFSSSVSHTASHDDPKRKSRSSRAATWRLNDHWRMCVIACYVCYVFKWLLHILFNYSFCRSPRVIENGCC